MTTYLPISMIFYLAYLFSLFGYFPLRDVQFSLKKSTITNQICIKVSDKDEDFPNCQKKIQKGSV